MLNDFICYFKRQILEAKAPNAYFKFYLNKCVNFVLLVVVVAWRQNRKNSFMLTLLIHYPLFLPAFSFVILKEMFFRNFFQNHFGSCDTFAFIFLIKLACEFAYTILTAWTIKILAQSYSLSVYVIFEEFQNFSIDFIEMKSKSNYHE